MRSSFGKVFMGAAGSSGDPVDDEFNRVSFLSHFDGANNGVNNAFDDSSASNHTVTAYGNVTQGSFGPFARPDGEWGVRFPQNHPHYIDISSSSDFAIASDADYTFEFFVFYDTKDSDHIIMDYRTGGANGTFPVLSISGDLNYDESDGSADTGKVSFNPHSGTLSTVKSASTLTFGAWNHVAIVRNSGTINFYINGTRDNNGFLNNTTVATAANIRFGDLALNSDAGADGNNSYYPGLQFSGVLSNFRFVNGTAVYSGSSITVPTSKLTAITNTKLLLFQSNRFVDNSSSGHTVPVSAGSPAVTAFGPFLTSAVYDAAVNGASAYFDGTADALSIAASPISASGNFTLEGWIYSNSASEQAIVGQYQGRSTGRMIITSSSGLLIFFQNGVTGGNNGSYVTVGQWAHFVVQRTGSNIAFYVNGARVLNNSANNIAQDYLVIGAEDVNSGNYPNNFDGYISNIRITSSAVYSEGTSITVPTAPYTTVTNTNFLLNMADGQAIDSAAQTNLTLFGNAKISTGQAKFGDTSMVFDETGDYVTLPNNSFKPFGTGNFTIECFARFATSTDGNGQGLFQLSSGYLNSAVRGPAAGANNEDGKWSIYHGTTFLGHGSLVPSQNTWYHVAYVRNSGVTKLYIDGTEILSVSDTTNYTDKYFVVGGWYSTSYLLNGYIDEFRISHMARYTSNFTAPTAAFADKGQ